MTKIAPGKGIHSVELGSGAIDLFTWHPTATPRLLLVVFHGMHADADNYRDRAIPLAKKLDAVVVAPRLGPPRFTVPFYQRGGIAPEGVFIPPGKRTVDLITPLIAWAAPGLPHVLIGHSAGGQFLSRLTAFAPTGATHYVIANPSTWVLPSLEDAVPYGFGGTPDAEAALRAYLALPITALLGLEDTGTENLSSEAEAVAQGPTRLQRGRNTFAKAKTAAARLGCPFGWTLAEVPGVGHDSAGMFASPQALAIFT